MLTDGRELITDVRRGLGRLHHRVRCGWLNMHSGSLESYGQYAYIDCVRCGKLCQPMPRAYAEARFGDR